MTGSGVSAGEYLITCPQCNARRVSVARRYWFLRGLVVATRYGSQTQIACEPCSWQLGWKATGTNLVAGWWCFPWGLATPFVVLQNVIEILLPPSRPFLDHALHQAGINPEDVRVNSRGLTGEQQRLIDALFLVLRRSMLADGHLEERELALAIDIARRITGNRLAADEITDGLLLADTDAIDLGRMNPEQAHLLLRIAFDITIADGLLQSAERALLETLARELRLPAGSVEELISAARRRRADSSASSDKSRPRARTKLEEALDILGVADPEDFDAINQAFRRQMLKYHPDRAGVDPSKQREFTERAQRINWARDYLLS